MLPARPPLPTPWNLPFQVSVGSQTSNWIFGATVPATRQIAVGMVPTGFGLTPAGRVCASVMVVSGSDRLSKSSQCTGFAANAEVPAKTNSKPEAAAAAARLIMDAPSLSCDFRAFALQQLSAFQTKLICRFGIAGQGANGYSNSSSTVKRRGISACA